MVLASSWSEKQLILAVLVLLEGFQSKQSKLKEHATVTSSKIVFGFHVQHQKTKGAFELRCLITCTLPIFANPLFAQWVYFWNSTNCLSQKKKTSFKFLLILTILFII